MQTIDPSATHKKFAATLAAIMVVVLCEAVALSQTGGAAAANEKIKQANEKIVQSNEIVARTFKAGNEALHAKNYDEAIKQYDEGIGNDPEHPAVPTLLTNKSVALRARGVDRYNAAIRANNEESPSLKAAAETDFRDAADTATKSVQMLKAQTVSTEAADKQRQDSNLYYALAARAEAMRLVATKVDPTQADAGFAAYSEYLEVEPAPQKRAKAQLDAAKMLLDAGASEKALIEFKKLLAVDPDNPDALLGAGMAGTNTNGDKTRQNEAITYFRRFLVVAPATHPMRADVERLITPPQSRKDSVADESHLRYEGDQATSPGAKAPSTRRKGATKRSRP